MFGLAGEAVGRFGSGGALLARPLSVSKDVGYDLLAGRDGVAVTGRAGGRALLERYRQDGSLDRDFRGGEPTLPATGSYFGEEGEVLTAAPGGGFFLATSSDPGGGIFRFDEGGGLQTGFGKGGEAGVGRLDRVLDVAPMDDGSLYAVGLSLPDESLELARLRPGGSLDRVFGGRGGLRGIGSGGFCSFRCVGLAVRRNGAGVVAGEASEKVLGEFASSGRRLGLGRRFVGLGRSESLRAMALDGRGRILLAGRIKHEWCVSPSAASPRPP